MAGITITSMLLDYSMDYGNITQTTVYDMFNVSESDLDDEIVSVDSFIEYKLADGVWRYASPFIIVIGSLGNLLSFIVMYQKALKTSVTSFLLRVLAIVDTIFLLTGLLRQWLRYVAHIDLRALSVTSCKLHIFLTYWSHQYSAWVLASVTLERFISVMFPHSGKRYLNQNSATILLTVIGLVISGICGHYFWTFSLVSRTNQNHIYYSCVKIRNKYFISYIWPWVDYVIFFILPFLIILTGNICIIVQLLYSKFGAVDSSAEKRVKLTSMTKNLLIVSFYFLFSTSPGEIFLATEPIWDGINDPHFKAQIHLFWAFCNMMIYSNNAINFWLYCLSGPRFRHHLLRLLIKNRIHPGDSQPTATIEMNVRSIQ